MKKSYNNKKTKRPKKRTNKHKTRRRTYLAKYSIKRGGAAPTDIANVYQLMNPEKLSVENVFNYGRNQFKYYVNNFVGYNYPNIRYYAPFIKDNKIINSKMLEMLTERLSFVSIINKAQVINTIQKDVENYNINVVNVKFLKYPVKSTTPDKQGVIEKFNKLVQVNLLKNKEITVAQIKEIASSVLRLFNGAGGRDTNVITVAEYNQLINNLATGQSLKDFFSNVRSDLLNSYNDILKRHFPLQIEPVSALLVNVMKQLQQLQSLLNKYKNPYNFATLITNKMLVAPYTGSSKSRDNNLATAADNAAAYNAWLNKFLPVSKINDTTVAVLSVTTSLISDVFANDVPNLYITQYYMIFDTIFNAVVNETYFKNLINYINIKMNTIRERYKQIENNANINVPRSILENILNTLKDSVINKAHINQIYINIKSNFNAITALFQIIAYIQKGIYYNFELQTTDEKFKRTTYRPDNIPDIDNAAFNLGFKMSDFLERHKAGTILTIDDFNTLADRNYINNQEVYDFLGTTQSEFEELAFRLPENTGEGNKAANMDLNNINVNPADDAIDVDNPDIDEEEINEENQVSPEDYEKYIRPYRFANIANPYNKYVLGKTNADIVFERKQKQLQKLNKIKQKKLERAYTLAQATKQSVDEQNKQINKLLATRAKTIEGLYARKNKTTQYTNDLLRLRKQATMRPKTAEEVKKLNNLLANKNDVYATGALAQNVF